jgi:hypothetical protein
MERRCRVKGRKDKEISNLKVLSADLGNSHLFPQKNLGGKVPQCADHLGLDQFDLFAKMRQARLDLIGSGIPVIGWPAL